MKKLLPLLLCAVLLFSGCSLPSALRNLLQKNSRPVSTPRPAAVRTEPTPKPIPAPTEANLTQAIAHALAAAQAPAENTPAYLLIMDERIEYEVQNVQQVSDTLACADVTVRAPDLYSILRALEGQVFTSSGEIDTHLTAAVEAAGLAQATLTLNFYYSAGSWQAEITDTFADACYGGLLRYRSEYYAAMEQEEAAQ